MSENLQLKFPGHHSFQKATNHSQGDGLSGRLFCVSLIVFVVVVFYYFFLFCFVVAIFDLVHNVEAILPFS